MQDNQGSPRARENEIDEEETSSSRQRLEQLRDDVDFLFHEIRTPLSAVISYAEFLQNNELPAAESKHLLEIIRSEGQRIDGLLDDFSRTFHREAGTWLSEMLLTTISVEDLLLDAAARFKDASPIHTLRVEISHALSPAKGDQRKLGLVMRNLIANAIKYSPDGGMICISATDAPDAVIVCVSDHGVGIPQEYLCRIFDREFRIEQPGQGTPRGSGLGLAMVERIIAYHGGQVRVESAPGKGSSFFFSLPKASCS